jgi:hypothetical protein
MLYNFVRNVLRNLENAHNKSFFSQEVATSQGSALLMRIYSVPFRAAIERFEQNRGKADHSVRTSSHQTI